MTDSFTALVAAARPEDTFLEDARSARRVRYRELDDRLRGVAGGLATRPGVARIALDIEDAVDLAVTHLAVMAAGRLSAPLDPHAPVSAQRRDVEALRCDLVVSDRPDRWSGRAVLHPSELDAAGDSDPATGGTGGVLMQTSGSTGTPKIVRLDTAQLLATANAVATNLELRPGDRGYNPLPLFHINGQVVAVLGTLVTGSTLVLDDRFHRTGFWDLMTERRITWINAVPAMLGILARELPERGPETLRLIRSASAPLPRTVRDRLQSVLEVPLIESYGMTEAGSQITAGALDASTPTGSVGRPAGADVQVRGVGTDGIGRIWIRGPGVIRGYEGGRAAERFDADGWLDTGDDGYFADGGELYIAGRSDDQINRGGELLYPAEIEDVLRKDDRVAEIAVIGRPDDTLGEVPVAYVVRRHADGDRDDLAADLAARAERELSRHKRPVDIHLVEDLPRTPTGKIRRAAVPTATGHAGRRSRT
ncbi:class I adenylate-forming enzyme family protein [uncultured Jatrophihabitans sp.]|uniref:class I adenylate-forming enzyme family protein n=1 Tax=uncultured Jatrophihabitans sp. TaxID=1610747 RepID=UPI0035CA8334